jgi:hypothetical protein
VFSFACPWPFQGPGPSAGVALTTSQFPGNVSGPGIRTWRHSPLTGFTTVKAPAGAAKARKAPQTTHSARESFQHLNLLTREGVVTLPCDQGCSAGYYKTMNNFLHRGAGARGLGARAGIQNMGGHVYYVGPGRSAEDAPDQSTTAPLSDRLHAAAKLAPKENRIRWLPSLKAMLSGWPR